MALCFRGPFATSRAVMSTYLGASNMVAMAPWSRAKISRNRSRSIYHRTRMPHLCVCRPCARESGVADDRVSRASRFSVVGIGAAVAVVARGGYYRRHFCLCWLLRSSAVTVCRRRRKSHHQRAR